MAHSGFSGSLTSPRFDLAVDMGHPFLNRTVDGFLKIGAVGACKVAAEETFECLHRGDVSKHKVERALKKMCKEGAYWEEHDAWRLRNRSSGVCGEPQPQAERGEERHHWGSHRNRCRVPQLPYL